MSKIFIIIIAIGFLSCSSKITNEELIGKYCWNNSENGVLEIFDNGAYKYEIKTNGQILENTGTWKLDSNINEIHFYEFSFISDKQKKGTWISRIRQRDNEIHLMYASEENIYLRKIK